MLSFGEVACRIVSMSLPSDPIEGTCVHVILVHVTVFSVDVTSFPFD